MEKTKTLRSFGFVGDIRDELKKVTWPTRTETIKLTVTVFAISLIVGLYVGIIDVVLAKWFVVHTQSGFEAKAKEALEQRIKTLGYEKKIFDIVIPMREIVTIKKGKKKNVKEKVFPGYLLIKMILDDDSWLVVRTTQGITGF